jgi:hypothetical protein
MPAASATIAVFALAAAVFATAAAIYLKPGPVVAFGGNAALTSDVGGTGIWTTRADGKLRFCRLEEQSEFMVLCTKWD